MDDLDRRQFLTLAASGLLALPGAGALASREQMPERPEGRTEHGRPDCKLVIGTGLVEAAPDRFAPRPRRVVVGIWRLLWRSRLLWNVAQIDADACPR